MSFLDLTTLVLYFLIFRLIVELAHRYSKYKSTVAYAMRQYKYGLSYNFRPDLHKEMCDNIGTPWYNVVKRYNYFVKALKGETYEAVLYKQMMSDNTELGEGCRSLIDFDWR